MDTENRLVQSPMASPHLPPATSDAGTLNALPSSPLPERPRHHQSLSTARKRTNEEVYQPAEQPKASPTAARFRQSVGEVAPLPPPTAQSAGTTAGELRRGGLTNDGMAATDTRLNRQPPAPSRRDLLGPTFVQQIHDYQEQLEQEFRDFELSLTETGVAGDLGDLDWDDLERRYLEDMRPHMALEQEITDEFRVRFEQFMLYMQVSSSHEADRAVKRLRTRIAVAQNTEQALFQQQAHHVKVLEAFQNAIALLGNV